MAIIELKGVTKEYGQGHTLVQALKPTDFQLEAGQFVAIIGPSGSGKNNLSDLAGPFANSLKRTNSPAWKRYLPAQGKGKGCSTLQ